MLCCLEPKALAKVNLNAPILLDAILFDRLAAHFGRRSSNIFCSLKCWTQFAFDQTLRLTILLDSTVFQCFAALPTKLCPKSSHVRAASQSLFKPWILVSFATNMADNRGLWMNSQKPETLISEYEARPWLWDTFSPLYILIALFGDV